MKKGGKDPNIAILNTQKNDRIDSGRIVNAKLEIKENGKEFGIAIVHLQQIPSQIPICNLCEKSLIQEKGAF